jgi:hypothetical protein
MQGSRNKVRRQHRRFRRKQSKSWCLVYVLREAPGKPVVYVGQTRQAPSERLWWHFKAIRQHEARGQPLTRLMKWIRSRPAPPIIEVIDDNGIWDVSEAVWIDRLRKQGEPLFNIMSVVKSRVRASPKWNQTPSHVQERLTLSWLSSLPEAPDSGVVGGVNSEELPGIALEGVREGF